jgi:superfamily I DNA/RNA helicase
MLELRDEGIPLEQMAVLYRAHFQSLEIQMELTVRGIPFAITSGLRFFEQAHIKDISAFMRFVVNRRDEVSFMRHGQSATRLRADGGAEAVERVVEKRLGGQGGAAAEVVGPVSQVQGAEEGCEALGAALLYAG